MYSEQIFTVLVTVWLVVILALVVAQVVLGVVQFFNDINNIAKVDVNLCNEARGVV